MKVAVVLHGDEPTQEELNLLRACEAVVCADGGVRPLLRANLEPDCIVGDLDSLSKEDYEWAEAMGVPIERHASDKDLTDGELALLKAFTLGAKSVLLLGGHGGRTAMFLANLNLLRRSHEAGLDAILIGHGEAIRFLSAPNEIALAGRTDHILDLIPVDGDAIVTLKGTKWEGEGIKLALNECRGVSNMITSDGASIRADDGTLLVIVERPVALEERKGRR